MNTPKFGSDKHVREQHRGRTNARSGGCPRCAGIQGPRGRSASVLFTHVLASRTVPGSQKTLNNIRCMKEGVNDSKEPNFTRA